MQLRTSFETKVLIAFVAAVLVVAGLTLVAVHVASEATAAAQLVMRTQKVLQGLAYTRSATLQIELSTQNYRITGDPAHLQARDAAVAQREAVLEQVRQETMDSAAQQARWIELREVLAQRRALSQRIEELRKSQGRAAADAFVATAPLRETRERAHRLMDAMESEERAELEERVADGETKERVLRAAGAVVLLLWSATLASIYALIRRQLAQAQASRLRLEDSEERLAITLRCIADGVLATDMQGHITRMNPMAEQLTGWPLAEALGQSVADVFVLVRGMDHVPMLSPLPGSLQEGGCDAPVEEDVLLRSRTGQERPVAWTATPKRDLGGRIRGMVLVFRDVTLERQAKMSIEMQNRLLAERVQERTEQLRLSNAHLRNVTSNVPAMIAYVDAQERYVYVNEKYQERFAPGQPEIIGSTVREVLGEMRYAVAEPIIRKVLQGEPQSYDWQPFADVWQAISYVPQTDAAGEVEGYYVLGSDITERKRAEARIQGLNAELAQRVHELERTTRALHTLSAGNRTLLRATTEDELLDGMCEAIVGTGGYGMAIVWYREMDEFGTLKPIAQRGYPAGLAALRFLRVSWREGEFSGGAVALCVRSASVSVVHDMASSPRYEAWRQHLGAQRSVMAFPLHVGGELIGALSVYDPEPHVFNADEAALLGESADDLAFGITTLRERAEQERVRDALYRLTHFDALTGLPNEAQFAEALRTAIDEAQPFAALQLDVDRLREVNDALGFSRGDQLLRDFAARLLAVAPSSSLVARLRGDEFAMLISNCDRDAADAVAKRLTEALAEPFPISDLPLNVSSKIGVTLFPEHGDSPQDYFRRMDISVLEARRTGTSHAFFDPGTDAQRHGRLSMATELRRAISENQLRLYLQPKLDMATNDVCGVEALVRWEHPKRGMVSPSEFIELAEHTGLIKPLTEWMLQAVMRQNKAWSEAGRALPIAVNLSARNLRDTELLNRISTMLGEFGLPAALLELEITESTVMEDAAFAMQVLHGLRNQGITLYVDDFGTGYSSLSYLQRLPVDCIKIDQSFVRDMLTSKDSAAIVRSTIDLVHDLGRKIVAEGIETREHWDRLLQLGCDVAQGYFIARPMPAGEFQGWLDAYRARA